MTTIILIAVGIAVLGLAVYFLRPVIQRKNYLRHFAEAYDNDIVIFDTETTGLNVLYDEIVQIAAVRVRDGQVVGEPFNIFLEKKWISPVCWATYPIRLSVCMSIVRNYPENRD